MISDPESILAIARDMIILCDQLIVLLTRVVELKTCIISKTVFQIRGPPVKTWRQECSEGEQRNANCNQRGRKAAYQCGTTPPVLGRAHQSLVETLFRAQKKAN